MKPQSAEWHEERVLFWTYEANQLTRPKAAWIAIREHQAAVIALRNRESKR